MQTTHEDNVQLQMFLSPAPLSRKGFNTPLFLATDIFAEGQKYDGERVVEYSDADTIENDVSEGHLRRSYFTELAAELDAQEKDVFPIKVGLVDFDDFGNGDGNGADYDPENPGTLYKTAYQKCKAADGDFYGVCPDIARDQEKYVNQDTNSDTNTEEPLGAKFMYELAKDVEGDRRVLFVQSDHDDDGGGNAEGWITSGFPNSLLGDKSGSGIIAEGLERTAFFYHDTTFSGADTDNFPSGSETRPFKNMAYAARHLFQDLNQNSGPSDLPLYGVDGLSGNILESERDYVEENHCNLGLPLPPAPMFVDPGHNAQGRSLYEILSVDWFYYRVSEDLQLKKVEFSKDDQKFPISTEGQEIMRNALGRRLSQGERTDHFTPGSTSITFPSITDEDKKKERLRATVRGEFLVSARKFEIDVYLT